MKPSLSNNIIVKILDKTYQVKCPADKVQELQDAAVYVDEQMREIRNLGKVTGTDRIAVIAALNIAYELLSSGKSDNHNLDRIAKGIQEMQTKIEKVLVQQESLEFLDTED